MTDPRTIKMLERVADALDHLDRKMSTVLTNSAQQGKRIAAIEAELATHRRRLSTLPDHDVG